MISDQFQDCDRAVFGNGRKYGEPLENLVWFCEQAGFTLDAWDDDFVYLRRIRHANSNTGFQVG